MRGTVLSISLVVAAGVAALVTLQGTWRSIVYSRDRYYEAASFGDVFVRLARAPNQVAERLERIEGVMRTYARVVGKARIPLATLDEPAQALVVSLPEQGPPPLNGVVLSQGRMPEAPRDEALLVELFAQRHGVGIGQTLSVIMAGRARSIRVVGLAMSPEFVLSVPDGGSAPAPERFAVLWMRRSSVETAYDLRGSFNDVVLELSPGARLAQVLTHVERVLAPYGSLGAISRARQPSNYFLAQDLSTLSVMATFAPLLFLAVAAFLLNVVLARTVELQRPHIATLKALGYGNREVGLSYLWLTMFITLGGALAGLVAGRFLGQAMTQIYVQFYRMPALAYHLDPGLTVWALVASVAAGVVGSGLAVRRVIALPPAEAMRPPVPVSYRRRPFASALSRLLTPSARMVGREALRKPARLVVGAVGIAAATSIVVIGQFFADSVDFLFYHYLPKGQSETLSVSFAEPVPERALHSLHALEGVRDVQPASELKARLRVGHRERLVSLVGHARRSDMRPLLDARGLTISLGPRDVLFTDTLARLLGVKPGDVVRVEPLQGERTPRTFTMTGTLSELMGLWVHMPSDALFALLGETPSATGAMLLVDREHVEAVQRAMHHMPNVSSVMRKDLRIAQLRKQTGAAVGAFALMLTLFAAVIAVAVIYNNALVALSTRSHELSSLRVLGFTRREVTGMLLGELSLQVLLGVPLGLMLGGSLADLMVQAGAPEAFRFPSLLTRHTLAVAALVSLAAALSSAALVARKLARLDLTTVLKTRE
jgi:putative ABC transport system permease protein